MVKLSILMFLRRLESQSRLVNSLIWSTMFINGRIIHRRSLCGYLSVQSGRLRL